MNEWMNEWMNELTKRTHLAKCTARLAKCAAHLAKCAARLPKCAARLVNPTNSGQMRTQLVKCARIWSIALRIWPNIFRIRPHMQALCSLSAIWMKMCCRLLQLMLYSSRLSILTYLWERIAGNILWLKTMELQWEFVILIEQNTARMWKVKANYVYYNKIWLKLALVPKAIGEWGSCWMNVKVFYLKK